jgi:homoserine dehydrogenase
VTANKKLLAEYGSEIFPLAESKGVDLYFGASVGGGIPIIRALREGLAGNRVESILGILNGTCNYILTRMEAEGISFETALAAAQKEGYAEADPTLDVDGHDTLHKVSILAALAYGFSPDVKSLPVSGIRGTVTAQDIEYAKELGYRIKLLGIVRGDGGEVEVRVAPTLVPRDNMLASVNGVFNAVMVKADLADTTLYYGRGAGRFPTASTVIGDIADVAFNRIHGSPLKVIIPKAAAPVKMKTSGEVVSRHYIRLCVKDEVGVMAKITGLLASHGVSIASVMQKDVGQRLVPIIILTHSARQKDIDGALRAIAELSIVDGVPVRLGIE